MQKKVRVTNVLPRTDRMLWQEAFRFSMTTVCRIFVDELTAVFG
jgi:hypothetical protein